MYVTKPGGWEFEPDESVEHQRETAQDREFERERVRRLGQALVDRSERQVAPGRNSGEAAVVLAILAGLGIYLVFSFFQSWMPVIRGVR